MTADNDVRKMLWQAYPRFGIADRLFLASGPVGLILLFVDWRVGLAVLLLGVPALYFWKQRELARAMRMEVGVAAFGGSGPRDQSASSAMSAMLEGQQMAVEIGRDWPDRDEYDNPAVSALIEYWNEGDDRWLSGRLHAFLSPGVLVPLPNFHIQVETRDGRSIFRGENATWLVDRLDLDYVQPAHELRSLRFDPEASRDVPQRLLFVMRGIGLNVIDQYLNEFGLETSFWIEKEPHGWQRLAPTAPPDW